jgi:hypothetical protein
MRWFSLLGLAGARAPCSRPLQPQPQSPSLFGCGFAVAIAAALRAFGPPVAVRSLLESARLPWLDIAFRRASATARELLPVWLAGAK